VLNLISNLAFLISIISLGNIKLKLVLQSFTKSILDVLKSFIKNLAISRTAADQVSTNIFRRAVFFLICIYTWKYAYAQTAFSACFTGNVTNANAWPD